jgi:hypothetical protein
MGHRLNPPCPERLVQFWVEPHIPSAHRLLRKVNDRLDGPGSTLLEGAAMHAFVEVDGVVAGYDILEGGACLTGLR